MFTDFIMITTKEYINLITESFLEQITTKWIEDAYNNLDQFIKSYQERYIEIRKNELISLGKNNLEAFNSARQSWRPIVWDVLVQLVWIAVQKIAEKHWIKITNDKLIKSTKNLSKELSLVRNNILIHYNEYSFLPDWDLILYTYNSDSEKVDVLCIISFKTSFRERFTETPYWKLKLLQNPVTEWIKVVMVTTDNDDEIWYISSSQGPRKARVVMEYELDAIFIANERFESTDKVSSIKDLFLYLSNLFSDRWQKE